MSEDKSSDSEFIARKNYLVGFFAYERAGGGPESQQELDALVARLKQTTDVSKYWSAHRVGYERPEVIGWTSVPQLQELWGLPLNDLIMARVHSLRPSSIRITLGAVTCDSVSWRVTIIVGERNLVERISQEVEVGYGCGEDVDKCLRSAKTGETPKASGGFIGHTAGLDRIDFQ